METREAPSLASLEDEARMGDAKTMRIVVLDGQSDPYAAKVTASIVCALDTGQCGGRSRGEASADAETPLTRESLRGPTTDDDVVHAADAAVVLDPGSMARAAEAGVGLSVVVFPSFDLAWGGDLADADRVVVAHERLVVEAIRRGAPRGRVDVAGPVAPLGFEVPADRGKLREELIDGPAGGVVLVSAAVLEEHGVQAVMVQLALVQEGTTFLFDVGRDAEAAETIRRLAPVHDLRAWLFAEEPGCERYWQLADVVVGRSRGYEVNRALAVGAPLVLLPPGRSDALAARTLEALGVGSDAEVFATLAVAIDRALEADNLEDARRDIATLDIPGAASRIADGVQAAWEERRAAGPVRRRGLPHGLEALTRDDSGGPPVAPAERPGSGPGDLDDLEGRIERELEALKRKLETE